MKVTDNTRPRIKALKYKGTGFAAIASGSNGSVETTETVTLECGKDAAGAVIDAGVEKLHDVQEVSDRWCGIVGNEDRGISSDVMSVCTGLIRIDMAPNVDSVSITVAAGIFLNGLREREKGGNGW